MKVYIWFDLQEVLGVYANRAAFIKKQMTDDQDLTLQEAEKQADDWLEEVEVTE